MATLKLIKIIFRNVEELIKTIFRKESVVFIRVGATIRINMEY